MYKIFIPSFLLCLLVSYGSTAQTWGDEKTIPWLTQHIALLADTSMHGRGYVKGGREKASAYLQKQFKQYHLKSILPGKNYAQRYCFQVNTFPGKMELSLGGRTLVPGKNYIIDAQSASFSGINMPLEKTDFATITNIEQWKNAKASLSSSTQKLHYLENVDAICKVLAVRRSTFVSYLPKGSYIIPQKDKFIWTVSQKQVKATVFYINDDSIHISEGSGNVHVDAKLLPKAKNDNIAGVVQGDVKDTFVAITAHYDHLGMMGDKTVFPGASDNASGTSMLLYLADYFRVHPQHYSILFIAFSGEEAGLLGSKYFTKHPLVPLKKIKFLTNIDIMGDASDGITVVNATEYPAQFKVLQGLNAENDYLPQVKSRGKAANSDHYYFTEAGVPSFFIYTNGGKGYYHDIFDTAGELSMNKIDKIAQLLIDFVKETK